MNDIDKMPPKCRDCALWELAREPYICAVCEEKIKKKPDRPSKKEAKMIYGALFNIEEQCNEMGMTLGEKRELVEKLHFGLNICHIHGILTDGEYNKALGRLIKMVVKVAMPKPSEGEDDAEKP